MPKTKYIIGLLTENKIQLLITLISVAIALINFLIIARLAPITEDITILRQEVEANVEKDKVDHPTFVSKDTFNQIVTRIDHISTRVDQIYGFLK